MPEKKLSKGGKVQVTGTVKWFDSTKGFGFIVTEEGNDVFVNHTGLPKINGRYTALKADQKVTFEITEGVRGPQAANVQVIS